VKCESKVAVRGYDAQEAQKLEEDEVEIHLVYAFKVVGWFGCG
jgi:hypothetical protein